MVTASWLPCPVSYHCSFITPNEITACQLERCWMDLIADLNQTRKHLLTVVSPIIIQNFVKAVLQGKLCQE